jgi:hypothetical protein
MQEKTAFFTIIARNYLAQAFALGESVLMHHPDSLMFVFVIDDADQTCADDIRKRGMNPLFPDSLAYLDFERLVFKYNVIEACTAVKPLVFQALMRQKFARIVYFDPDILCFAPIDSVFELLNCHAAVLTTSASSPQGNERFPDDRFLLMHGAYNLGFLALRNDERAVAMIEWWREKLERQCLVQVDHSLFVDQKWMDLLPAYFEGVAILKHRGCNMSWWNLHERTLKKDDGRWIISETGEPLVFFHFSNFIYDDIEKISRGFPDSADCCGENTEVVTLSERSDLRPLFTEYRDALKAKGHEKFRKVPYGFDHYENNEPILHQERRLYLGSEDLQKRFPHPSKIVTPSFLRHCRGSGIRSRLFLGKTIKRMLRVSMRIVIWCVGLQNFERARAFCAEQSPLAVADHLKSESRK